MLFLKNISLRRKLRRRPQPLIDAQRRTVISWSPKAACTRVLIWYYQRTELLNEALAYHRWPHKHRNEVLYKSRCHLDSEKQLIREGTSAWDYVKVVRDPVKRCISSYRHALKTGYADQSMSQTLGREVNHRHGFSYETFLEYLRKIDLSSCNPHHRFQTHPVDKIIFHRTWLIDIDEKDLDSELASIDELHGVNDGTQQQLVTDFLRKDTQRYANSESQSESLDSDQWLKPLKNSDTEHWPKQALENTTEATHIVRELYQRDCKTISALKQRSINA